MPNVIAAPIVVQLVALGIVLIKIIVPLAINAYQDIIGHKVKVVVNAKVVPNIVKLVLTPQLKDVLNAYPTTS